MVTEKMIEALKPCPFCGGSDVHLRHHQANQMSWVSCVGCGLEAPSETGVSDDDAVTYWNRRDEAAILTGAEPVAWLVKRYNFDGVLFDTELRFVRPTLSATCKTEMVPLYTATPAPSVAVKALQDAAHVPPMPETVDRRPFISATGTHLEGYFESDNDWAGDNFEAVTWLADNHAAIRSALSAQVQDVATAREFADRMFNKPGFMLSEEYKGKPAVTIIFPDNAERNQFYSAIVDLSTHRTPPAPAAKLEEKP